MQPEHLIRTQEKVDSSTGYSTCVSFFAYSWKLFSFKLATGYTETDFFDPAWGFLFGFK